MRGVMDTISEPHANSLQRFSKEPQYQLLTSLVRRKNIIKSITATPKAQLQLQLARRT
jgi:hypothetical protein